MSLLQTTETLRREHYPHTRYHKPGLWRQNWHMHYNNFSINTETNLRSSLIGSAVSQYVQHFKPRWEHKNTTSCSWACFLQVNTPLAHMWLIHATLVCISYMLKTKYSQNTVVRLRYSLPRPTNGTLKTWLEELFWPNMHRYVHNSVRSANAYAGHTVPKRASALFDHDTVTLHSLKPPMSRQILQKMAADDKELKPSGDMSAERVVKP